jgi:protein-L-isoaspartate(D-aspartate) O-methyltransferase
MVAAMTEYLDVKDEDKVLEIGTGSGYQTAILAELAGSVYTVERIGPLQERAKEILDQLGYENIEYRVGDGTLGWREKAPYDRIIVTAGAPKVPQPLKDQLAEDGIIIIPVGGDFGQALTKVEKKKGAFKEHFLMDCIFVKLKGKEGW